MLPTKCILNFYCYKFILGAYLFLELDLQGTVVRSNDNIKKAAEEVISCQKELHGFAFLFSDHIL